MLEKTMKEFLEDAERLTVGAIVNDDFLMIKTTCGNAVLISENEWRILIDVFKMMINRDESETIKNRLSAGTPRRL